MKQVLTEHNYQVRRSWILPWGIHTFQMNVVDADHYHFDFDGDEFQIEVPQNDLAEQEGVHLMGLSQLLVSAQDNTNKSHLVQSGTQHASQKMFICVYTSLRDKQAF